MKRRKKKTVEKVELLADKYMKLKGNPKGIHDPV